MKPHICVLGLLQETHIGMGRVLLSEVIRGEVNDRIKKLKLNKLVYYDSLPLYDKRDIMELIDLLVYKAFIKFEPIKSNKFIKVLVLTDKGLDELKNPSSEIKLEKNFDGFYSKIEEVTNQDKKTFETLGSILDNLSDEQKKAVIHNSKKILCIAGAGSGKTRVLTKRAWFLNKYKSQQKILCITFTRKARQEMINRLSKMDCDNIDVETFNSFCEKYLRQNHAKIYDKNYKVIDFKKKIQLISKILQELDTPIDKAVDMYYSKKKIYSSDRRTLFIRFINDIFTLLDYQRNNYLSRQELFNLIDSNYSQSSILIKNIIVKIKQYKTQLGYRDFTDQIIHVIEFFKKNKNSIPIYNHILVDEYQDINTLQFELINLLNPDNLFCVGDPRQSIYGWRSSKVEFILDFEKLFNDSVVLQLSTNYRSQKSIVDVCNKMINTMKLPDLQVSNGDEGSVKLIKHGSEDSEAIFITQSVLSMKNERKNIFVLSRTNKQIENIAKLFDMNNIKYLKRTIEESKQNIDATSDQVTLSTIHAIKGLEADTVYIMGVNNRYFPCKAIEHPILEAVKINDTYDKYEEERRLLYVAMSRAKKSLIVNYTSTISKFLTESLFKQKVKKNSQIKYKVQGTKNLYSALKSWRLSIASELGVPAYQIFNDNTLNEICYDMPTNLEELKNVNGFGDFKTRKYGNEIVKIILENS
jgi:superfamily I DNA/RNA helicase